MLPKLFSYVSPRGRTTFVCGPHFWADVETATGTIIDGWYEAPTRIGQSRSLITLPMLHLEVSNG